MDHGQGCDVLAILRVAQGQHHLPKDVISTTTRGPRDAAIVSPGCFLVSMYSPLRSRFGRAPSRYSIYVLGIRNLTPAPPSSASSLPMKMELLHRNIVCTE